MSRWDIFCAVVDNFGDIGTCWRLARQLAIEHGLNVRLWVDRLECLATLCPGILAVESEQVFNSIEVRRWESEFPNVDAADVVIEAFACELPGSYVAAMAGRAVSPIWINLEYLSAETWVEECHLLPSPHTSLPRTKFFFFPGFTTKTGGLLKERDLRDQRAAFGLEAQAEFWKSIGVAESGRADELRVSLFCYQNPVLPELLRNWVEGPIAIRLLTSPGAATLQSAEWLQSVLQPGKSIQRGSLTVQALPFLPQQSYDQLLWSCDVNFVRGEDSFVRAQWAQRPFVWQIYPQEEGVHLKKLDAFLSRYGSDLPQAESVRSLWLTWNGFAGVGGEGAAWQNFAANWAAIQQYGAVWSDQLDRAGDLANNLVCFVQGKWGDLPQEIGYTLYGQP